MSSVTTMPLSVLRSTALKPPSKLVYSALVALCDNPEASCVALLPEIAETCALSEMTVQRAFVELRHAKLISRHRDTDLPGCPWRTTIVETKPKRK